MREAGDDSAEMLARSGTRPGPELVIYSSSNDVRDTRQNGFIKRRRYALASHGHGGSQHVAEKNIKDCIQIKS